MRACARASPLRAQRTAKRLRARASSLRAQRRAKRACARPPDRPTAIFCTMPIRCLVALVAGVALAMAFPPTHAFWLLPFCVAAFFVVTDELPARRAWLPGLVFGGAFQFTLLWWLHVTGTVPWLGLSLTQTFWYGVLGAAAVPLRRLTAAPVWLAAAWVAMESFRCTWRAACLGDDCRTRWSTPRLQARSPSSGRPA